MKVFISHKQEDKLIASEIAKELKRRDIDYYLDTEDTNSYNKGNKELTEYLKSSMRSCTDLLVVMSQATKSSMWVPFEIGMAANQELPTVTFLHYQTELPEFLTFWPRLRYMSDISKYVEKANSRINRLQERNFAKSIYSTDSFIHGESSTDAFYRELKAVL